MALPESDLERPATGNWGADPEYIGIGIVLARRHTFSTPLHLPLPAFDVPIRPPQGPDDLLLFPHASLHPLFFNHPTVPNAMTKERPARIAKDGATEDDVEKQKAGGSGSARGRHQYQRGAVAASEGREGEEGNGMDGEGEGEEGGDGRTAQGSLLMCGKQPRCTAVRHCLSRIFMRVTPAGFCYGGAMVRYNKGGPVSDKDSPKCQNISDHAARRDSRITSLDTDRKSQDGNLVVSDLTETDPACRGWPPIGEVRDARSQSLPTNVCRGWAPSGTVRSAGSRPPHPTSKALADLDYLSFHIVTGVVLVLCGTGLESSKAPTFYFSCTEIRTINENGYKTV
ncbi:hypothetical protein K438DRAFT_2153958 [Mycena galopus ATCC 62051]|nr:hypothetical protein K438DRAFT_2153958 [Mycena galopus ATCC 62051]